MKASKTAVFDVRTLLLLDILIMIFMLISGKPEVTLAAFRLAAAGNGIIRHYVPHSYGSVRFISRIRQKLIFVHPCPFSIDTSSSLSYNANKVIKKSREPLKS